MRSDKYNAEGYIDMTAYTGIREATKAEDETDRRCNDLLKVVKFIIRLAGFELVERIQLKDTKSGREYK